MKPVIIIVIAFVLLIPVGMAHAEPETLDFENCEGILTVDELKNAIKLMEEITVRSRGLTPVDEKAGLQTMCDSTFELLDKSISMAIVVMDSSDTASALYKENLDAFSGGDFEIREYVTFWNNFDVTVNDQNVGSFMISQYDKFFINFHTSFDKDNPSLVDVDELRVLSTIVQKKILDLDDVLISPPNPLPDNDVGPATDEPPPKPSPAPIEDGELLSPRKQVSQGIEPESVVCNEGLVLILRHNGSPACVKEKTAEIFEERGWGVMPPPCCKKLHQEPEESTLSQQCSGTARCIIGTVTSVIDGDTIKVDSQSIRLALASAPELDEFNGGEARNLIDNRCPAGSTAIVDEDDGQMGGSYGRIIAVIYCNGFNLNEELLDANLGEISSGFCINSEFATQAWAIRHGCMTSEPNVPAQETQSDCDESYPDFCIPTSPPDLDCKDIPQKRFTVLQPDPHRFDADKDGIGCES